MQRGDLLVTLSKDHTSRSWNVITRTAGAVFSGHSASVSRGWLSKEGDLLITGSEDSTARVWDVPSGRNTLVLAHKAPVVFVSGSQSRRRAFTCTATSAAWLWNVEDGSCTSVLRVRATPPAPALCPDARQSRRCHTTLACMDPSAENGIRHKTRLLLRACGVLR